MPKPTKSRFIKTFGGDLHSDLFTARAGKVQTTLDGIDTLVAGFKAKHKFSPGIDSTTKIASMKASFAAAQQKPDDRAKYNELKALKKQARYHAMLLAAYSKKVGAFLDQWKAEKQDPPASELPQMLPSDLKKLIRTAGAFHFNLEKLAPAEAVAVFQYTDNFYLQLNKHLLGIADPPVGGQELSELEAVKELTVSAMKKLPNKPVTSQRGEARWPGDTAQYVVGNVFTLAAFWSSGVGYAFDGEWQITIYGKTGKDVQALSANPKENEVLFPPGTTFRVLAVTIVNPDGSRTEVTLQEV